MPTAEEQVFTLGTDLTPTLGAGVALIEQAIELATTTSYRGLVIYSETTPATSGQPSGYPTGWYEWHKRCLWLKPSTGEIFQWNGTTWALGLAKPGANSVGTSALIDDSVTIAKLSPTGGQQYQIIRVNDAEDEFEYIDAADLFGNNEIDIAKLGGSSTGSYVLTRNATSKAWTAFTSATLIPLFGANQFPVNNLVHGSALQVPMMNAGATAITWASVLTGIADYTVPLTKISKTIADAGKWLKVQPDGSVQAEALPSSAASVTFASSGEVVSGTEAAKAIAPSTARYIPGARRVYGSIILTVNNGGTDLLIGAAIAPGAVGMASVTVTAGSLPSTIRIVLTEAILAVTRKVDVYPRSSGAAVDGTLLNPAAVTYLPGTNTYTVTRINDTTLDISWGTLSVPSTGDYYIELHIS